jgi:hypothetical protein
MYYVLRITFSLRQQQLQIFLAHAADEAVVGVDDGVGEVAFGFLELEDFFLDGVAGDEAVGEDLAGLADAVGAVDGLGFDSGIPPGVEQEDVIGGGEVKAEAAGFEADEEEFAVGVVLEAVDLRLAFVGAAVEVFVIDAVFIEVLAEDAEHFGELRKDERLVSFFEDFPDLREEHIEFGAGAVGFGRIDEAGVDGGLTEAEERFEDMDLGAIDADVVDLFEEEGAVVIAEVVVLFALFGFELAVEGLLKLGREVFGDPIFGAAEDERAKGLGEELFGDRVRVAAGAAGHAEHGCAAEHAGVEEFEETPQFAEVVFDGRAAESKTLFGLDKSGGFGGRGLGVFDGLGFVEDAAIKRVIFEESDVPPQSAVGGDDEVVVAEVVGALDAVVTGMVENAQPGREAGGFLNPVIDEGFRDDGEGSGRGKRGWECRRVVLRFQIRR